MGESVDHSGGSGITESAVVGMKLSAGLGWISRGVHSGTSGFGLSSTRCRVVSRIGVDIKRCSIRYIRIRTQQHPM